MKQKFRVKGSWLAVFLMLSFFLFLSSGCGEKIGLSSAGETEPVTEKEEELELNDFRNDLKKCDEVQIVSGKDSNFLKKLDQKAEIEFLLDDVLLITKWKPDHIPQKSILNYQYKCVLYQQESIHFAQGSQEAGAQSTRLKNTADLFIYDEDHYIRISIQGFTMDFKIPDTVDFKAYAEEAADE